MALTPQEQAELDKLELEQLEAEYAASQKAPAAPAAPATEAPKAPRPTNPRTGLSTDPRDATAGAVAMSRYVVPLMGSTGGLPGVAASGLGEKMAQVIEGSDRPGDVQQAMIMGGVPLGGARGVWAGIKEALKLGTAGAVAKQAQSLGNDGKMASATDTAIAAAAPAALGLAGRGLGRVAGAISGNVTPEELARVQAEAARIKMIPKNRRAASLIEQGGALPPADVGDGGIKNWIMQQLSGKDHLGQQASIRNEPVLRRGVREDIGLPPEGNLGQAATDAAKEMSNKPYKTIAATSPEAAADLDRLTKVRDEIRDMQKVLDGKNGDLELAQKIAAKRQEAAGLEDMMMAHAEAITNPVLKKNIQRYESTNANIKEMRDRGISASDPAAPVFEQYPDDRTATQRAEDFWRSQESDALLGKERVAAGIKRRIDGRSRIDPVLSDIPKEMADLLDARVKRAKVGDLESSGAINYGREELIPSALATLNANTNGRKLTGNMKEAALIAEAFPGSTQEVASIRSPGVSRLSGLAAGQALAHGSGTGAVTAAIPLLGEWAREQLLSPESQRKMIERVMAGPSPKTSADPVLTAIIQRIMLQEEAARNRQ